MDRALCSQLLEHILILGGELLGEMADKKKSLPHFPGLLSCIFTLAPVVDRSYILIIQTLSTWIPNGYVVCVLMCVCVRVCVCVCICVCMCVLCRNNLLMLPASNYMHVLIIG